MNFTRQKFLSFAFLFVVSQASPMDVPAADNDIFASAGMANNLRRVQELLAQGISANSAQVGDGITLLMEAVRFGRGAIATALIRAGADVNARDRDGRTALMNAAQIYSDAASILIRAGANVNVIDRDGTTALQFAVYRSKIDNVSILINAGADVNVKSLGGSTSLHQGVDGNVVMVGGSTPLMCAIHNNRLDIVKILINARANVNTIDSLGSTPLMYAKQYDPALRAALIQAGAQEPTECTIL